jgi:amino acid transporter
VFDNSILFPSLPAVSLTETLIVLTIASIAYFVVFNKFEKHVPIRRRIIKLVILVGALAVIGTLFSRFAFWSAIALMTIGQIYVHGVYFPQHGVNGWTAEPYDKYLALTERMKGKK